MGQSVRRVMGRRRQGGGRGVTGRPGRSLASTAVRGDHSGRTRRDRRTPVAHLWYAVAVAWAEGAGRLHFGCTSLVYMSIVCTMSDVFQPAFLGVLLDATAPA